MRQDEENDRVWRDEKEGSLRGSARSCDRVGMYRQTDTPTY